MQYNGPSLIISIRPLHFLILRAILQVNSYKSPHEFLKEILKWDKKKPVNVQGRDEMEHPFLYADDNKRYHTLAYHLKRRFGRRVFKASIDAGFTCPNLDGTRGTGGCTYCQGGSGAFAPGPAFSITRQIQICLLYTSDPTKYAEVEVRLVPAGMPQGAGTEEDPYIITTCLLYTSIDAMREIGDAMPSSLKETGKGGLAATPTGCRICQQMKNLF